MSLDRHGLKQQQHWCAESSNHRAVILHVKMLHVLRFTISGCVAEMGGGDSDATIDNRKWNYQPKHEQDSRVRRIILPLITMQSSSRKPLGPGIQVNATLSHANRPKHRHRSTPAPSRIVCPDLPQIQLDRLHLGVGGWGGVWWWILRVLWVVTSHSCLNGVCCCQEVLPQSFSRPSVVLKFWLFSAGL